MFRNLNCKLGLLFQMSLKGTGYIQPSIETYIVCGNKKTKLTHKSLDLAFSWCKEALVTSMISNVNTGFTLNWVHMFKAIFCTFLLFS